MRFAKEVFTYLTDDFGGHPFLIRQACSQLHKFIQKENKVRPFLLSKEYYQAKKEAATRNIYEYIELILVILRERYREEYELLVYLANGEFDTFSSFAKESPEWTKHLIGYGLVSTSPELPGRYFFRIKVVCSAILEKENKKALPNSDEARWKIISEDRNKFERKLREVTRFLLKANLGEAKAKEEAINAMKKPAQKAKATGIKYDDIFGEKMKNELYLLDLKRVIESNWVVFSKIFKGDQVKFLQFMDIVNNNRVEAHAKTISEHDFTLVKSSLDWLWNCLESNC